MPTLPIPLTQGANQAIEEIGLSSYNATAMDVYFDSNGNVARRPGLVEFVDVGVDEAIIGIYWWDRQSRLIVATTGHLYQITGPTSPVTTAITGTILDGSGPVYWADFGTDLYATNGGHILRINSGWTSANISDADAPTAVSQICAFDDYLMALKASSQQVHYSDASDPTAWSGTWITALSKPDYAIALNSQNDILEVVGKESWEGWRNDGSTPFVKEPQYTVNSGIVSGDTLVFVENHWYYMDSYSRVMRINGRTPEPVNLSLNAFLKSMPTVINAFAYLTFFDKRPQYVLVIPSSPTKSIALDVYSGLWTELGLWVSVTSTYDRFVGTCACVASPWNMVLVGTKSLTGQVFKLDSTNAEDDGEIMRSFVRTPSIHWDHPELRKRSSRMDIYAKKTTTSPSTGNMVMTVRWRDNGSTTWKTTQTVTLTRVSTTEYHGYINRLGSYYTRQYEIVMADDSPMVLSRVMETFRILGAKE